MPKVTFIERDGTRREFDAPVGLSLLEIAHKHDIDLEGACEGSLACSTCHVVVDQIGRHTSELQSLLQISLNCATGWKPAWPRPHRKLPSMALLHRAWAIPVVSGCPACRPRRR